MILLMGIAGSGKGTQGKLLAEKLGYHVIAMGDVVRARMTDEQRERVMKGDLLRDDEVTELLEEELNSFDNQDNVLLDGYPRSIPQAQWLVDQVKAGRFTLDHAFHLVASREAVKARLLDRARADDNDTAIEKRFDEYERATAPIIDWLAEHYVNVINIDAERPVETISEELVTELNRA